MAAIVDKTPMTLDEFLALPDDGVERDLINGVVRVWSKPGEDPMARRNRFHSSVLSRLAKLIENWIDTQPPPRGGVFVGEVGCILRPGDNGVGIDVAYLSPARLAEQSDRTTMIDGPPTLAAEVLSPSNSQEEIDTKVKAYLKAGVPIVWVVHPTFRTVTVYRPDGLPIMVNESGELTAEPQLPGFRCRVSDLFR
ncbi:MAG TPA: Uma2 family endonuclease [Gemmataceae bacterium]|jgi:Uma2 family endonuclease|nr:Uma2 family endonuclease [Gemmataceae bacterium]